MPLPPLRVQAPNKDTRLLVGTALSMLVNTAPQPERGASAALALFQLPDRGACSIPTLGERLVKGTAGTGVFGYEGRETGATQQQCKLDSATMSCSWGLGAPGCHQPPSTVTLG